MTVQPFVDRNRSYKPRPWNVDRRLVDPRWQWAWDGLQVLLPFWSVPTVIDVVRHDAAVSNLGALNETTQYGRVLGMDTSTDNDIRLRKGILHGVTELSIGMRVKPEGGSNNPRLIVSDANNVYQPRMRTDKADADDHWDFRIADSTGTWQSRVQSTHNTAEKGVWKDLFFVYDGSDCIIYIDGEEDASVNIGSVTTNDPGDQSAIGDNMDSATSTETGTTRTFGGQFAWGGLWERAMTADEIRRFHHDDPFGPFRRTTYNFFTTAATGGQTITRQIEDTFTFSETQNRDFDGNRILSESFTFSENLIAERSLTRIVEDTFTFAETLIRDLILTRLPVDSFGFGENLVAKINGTVVGAAEAGTRFINQFSSLIKDQTLDDNIITDFVDGIFS